MSNLFYKIPLNVRKAMDGQDMPSCDLRESITQNLELIIVTRFGEQRSDPSFGCEIWDLDFELIVSARMWEEKLRHSMLRSISRHEPRLSNTEILVAINDMEKFNILKQTTEIKKKVNIQVLGIIHKTGERFEFRTDMFLSPLSLD